MINLDNYYSFPASEVSYIAVNNKDGGYINHPYELTVNLKSGRGCSISYKNEHDRNEAKRRIVIEIERELRSDTERIQNRLYLIEDKVKRIDRRQLRIWRQLNRLIGVPVEDEE